MNKEFIPYEQALELKELGFDEECFTYNDDSKLLRAGLLYQQAFRWFREKYELLIWIQKDWQNGECFGYEGTLEEKDGFRDCGTYNTYEEAELACLKKLIEIAKNEKKNN